MIWRVRDQRTFRQLRRRGRTVRRGRVAIRWIPAHTSDPPRVAFGVPRKVGSAVTRNRLRRQLWHHLLERAQAGDALPSGAYLVSVEPGAETAQLLTDLDGALAAVGSRS